LKLIKKKFQILSKAFLKRRNKQVLVTRKLGYNFLHFKNLDLNLVLIKRIKNKMIYTSKIQFITFACIKISVKTQNQIKLKIQKSLLLSFTLKKKIYKH